MRSRVVLSVVFVLATVAPAISVPTPPQVNGDIWQQNLSLRDDRKDSRETGTPESLPDAVQESLAPSAAFKHSGPKPDFLGEHLDPGTRADPEDSTQTNRGVALVVGKKTPTMTRTIVKRKFSLGELFDFAESLLSGIGQEIDPQSTPTSVPTDAE